MLAAGLSEPGTAAAGSRREATGLSEDPGMAVAGDAERPLGGDEPCCRVFSNREGWKLAGDAGVGVADVFGVAATWCEDVAVLSDPTREPAVSGEVRVVLLGGSGSVTEAGGASRRDWGEVGFDCEVCT